MTDNSEERYFIDRVCDQAALGRSPQSDARLLTTTKLPREDAKNLLEAMNRILDANEQFDRMLVHVFILLAQVPDIAVWARAHVHGWDDLTDYLQANALAGIYFAKFTDPRKLLQWPISTQELPIWIPQGSDGPEPSTAALGVRLYQEYLKDITAFPWLVQSTDIKQPGRTSAD